MNGRDMLASLRNAGWDRLYPSERIRISVGLGTCGKAAGAQAVFDRLVELVSDAGLAADVVPVGCAGMCFAEPLVEVLIPGWPRAVYGNADPVFCDKLVKALVRGRYPKQHRLGFIYRNWTEGFDTWVDYLDEEEAAGSDEPEEERHPDDLSRHPFLALQVRRLTAAWGRIVPWSIEEYAAEGGYEALRRSVFEQSSTSIIDLVEQAGLRGRGGAGFPTGHKWRAVAASPDPERYVIANADEGDPGAYMDRSLMESDPHHLLEGMALAARAVGATQGFILIRSEYAGAIESLERALVEAHEYGILSSAVFGSSWHFDITIVRSAGAYICGEEGALLEALEGRRPDPRKKPPYPSEAGLGGHPTCINNVETFANVPSIVLHGPERFRACGTPDSPGTKVFSLAGSIERPGLIEVPFGITPARVVAGIAGIAKDDLRNVVVPDDLYPDESEPSGNPEADGLRGMAIQVGGPSGAILPLSLEGLTLDFEGLGQAGGIVGSGGIVVLGRRVCVVDTIRYFLEFSARSSCGRCHACRDLIADAATLVGKICDGQGDISMLGELETLGRRIPAGSKCALGKMAVNPLVSGLRHFRSVFERHIEGSCPSLVCKELMHFEVVASACPGCLCCLPSCPAGAIKGRFGQPFVIDQAKCTKCWMCVSQCPYPALMALPVPIQEAPAAQPGRKDHLGTPPSGGNAAAPTGSSPAVAPPDAASSNGEKAPAASLANCVLCNRCVDACREVGASALFFSGRGKQRELVKPLFHGESPCTDCSSCLDACPTGAIKDLIPNEMTSAL